MKLVKLRFMADHCRTRFRRSRGRVGSTHSRERAETGVPVPPAAMAPLGCYHLELLRGGGGGRGGGRGNRGAPKNTPEARHRTRRRRSQCTTRPSPPPLRLPPRRSGTVRPLRERPLSAAGRRRCWEPVAEGLCSPGTWGCTERAAWCAARRGGTKRVGWSHCRATTGRPHPASPLALLLWASPAPPPRTAPPPLPACVR